MSLAIVGQRGQDVVHHQKLALPSLPQEQMAQLMSEHTEQLITAKLFSDRARENQMPFARQEGQASVHPFEAVNFQSSRHSPCAVRGPPLQKA